MFVTFILSLSYTIIVINQKFRKMETMEITKQEKIVINKDQLREVLKEEIKNALDFDWSGWKIPIYVSENGKVSAGEWLSNNSYQPGAIEIIGVKPWNIEWDMVADAMNYDSIEELTEDDKEGYIDVEVDNMIDSYISDIERFIETPEFHDPEIEEDDLPIEIDDDLMQDEHDKISIAVYENEESEKIIKFIKYNELRNDIKQMYESITAAFEDEDGDIVFVTDGYSYYK